jgi:AGZA family xanthine/uracil permease-like MFS transporter
MLSDFFDTMGTVIAIGKQGNFLDESGNYPHSVLKRILLVDSLGAAFGGLAGASSNTTYIESAAGVSEGGRTGLASVVTGLLFLAAMFFAPLVGVIPAQATAPALIIVGLMMFNSSIFPIFQGLGEMDQGEAVAEGLSAFLAMVVMPFTYSITDGIGAGFITYTLLSLWFGKRVHWMMYVATAAFIVYFLSPV